MPNGRGLHPGIFALANGLAKDGKLSPLDPPPSSPSPPLPPPPPSVNRSHI